MTNFTKRKTRKRHNKNNRKKRTRKLSGGTPPTSEEIEKVKIQKQKVVDDIKKMIVGQKERVVTEFSGMLGPWTTAHPVV